MDRTSALNYVLNAGKRLFQNRNILTGQHGTSHDAADRNAVQEEIMAAIEAAGLVPDANDWTQLLQAIGRLAGGAVGTCRNLRALQTVAGAGLTVTADELVVKTALGAQARVLSGFNKTLALGSAGAGGMDTGAAPASGYVAIYAIFNPTTGASALLAQAAGAARAEVYGGANMPAGYTHSALVAVWPTNAGSNMVPGLQVDRRFSMPQQAVYSGAGLGGPTLLNLAGAVPVNAKRVRGYGGFQSSDPTSAVALTIGSTSALFDVNSGSDLGQGSITFDVQMATAQQVHWQSASSAGIFGANIFVTGFEI